VGQLQGWFASLGFVKNTVKSHPVLARVFKYLFRLGRWLVAAYVEEKFKRLGLLAVSLFGVVESVLKLATNIVRLPHDADGLSLAIVAGQALINFLTHSILAAMPFGIAVVFHTAFNAFADTYEFYRHIRYMLTRHVPEPVSEKTHPMLEFTNNVVEYPTPDFQRHSFRATRNGVPLGPHDIWEHVKEFSDACPPRGSGMTLLVDSDHVSTMAVTTQTPKAFLIGYILRVQPEQPEPDNERWRTIMSWLATMFDPTDYPVVEFSVSEQIETYKKYNARKKQDYTENTLLYEQGGITVFKKSQLRPNMSPKDKESLRLRCAPDMPEPFTKNRIFACMKSAAAIPVMPFMEPLTKSIFACIRAGEFWLGNGSLFTTRKAAMHDWEQTVYIDEDDPMKIPRRAQPLLIKFEVSIAKTMMSVQEKVNIQRTRPGLHISGSTDDTLYHFVGTNDRGTFSAFAGTDLVSCDRTMRAAIHRESRQVYEPYIENPRANGDYLSNLHSGKRKARFSRRIKGQKVDELEFTYMIEDAYADYAEDDGTYTNSGGKNTNLTGQLGATGACVASLCRWAECDPLYRPTTECRFDLGYQSEIEYFVKAFTDVHAELGLELSWQVMPFAPYHTANYLSMSFVETDIIHCFPTSYTKLHIIKTDPTLYFGGSRDKAIGMYMAGASFNPMLKRTPEGRAYRDFLRRHSSPYLQDAEELWQILRRRLPEYEFNPMHNLEATDDFPELKMEDMIVYFENMVDAGIYTQEVFMGYAEWVNSLKTLAVGEKVENEYLRESRSYHYGEILSLDG